MSPPTVSIVIATYNSSHLLRYALESIRRQDFEDWEAIVVGDHCTDDSAEVVEALGDARFRFENLERNSGQQATPNNVGVRRARGEFLAFLNHDDLFLPSHLSMNLERMRNEPTDLLCCPFAEIPPEQIDSIPERRIQARVGGYAKKGRFNPNHFHIASSWFMRRALADRVGPWRVEAETFVTPSQDWLFRAWRMGAAIRCPRRVSMIAIPCGFRKDSYRRRESPEHDFIYREVIETDALRADLMAAVEASMEGARLGAQATGRGRPPRFIRKARRLFERLLIRFDIHPRTPALAWRHGRRGGLIRDLKRFTG